MGDTDGDGDYDALYSFGARSSVCGMVIRVTWCGQKKWAGYKAKELGIYDDDNRSDDKGVEPEAVTIGKVGNKYIAFVGMERADAVAVYDVSNPAAPAFIKMFGTGDAPEGVLFISSSKAPLGKSLLVVSSENDGVVKIYKADKL